MLEKLDNLNLKVFDHFLIWIKVQVFDKVLGNFENLYIRNAIKITYGGGLGRFEVQNLPTLKRVLSFGPTTGSD